jgi:hypothetical protein
MRKFEPVRDLYQRIYDHRPSPSTVTEMKKQGLKTVRIGGKICTAEDYLRAHVEGESSAVEEADKELRERGIRI